MNLASKFAEFSKPNYFSRVEVDHPLELHVGLDDECRKAIELRAKFLPRKIKGTAAIEVNQYKKKDYNTIRFSLIDEEISGLFYKFCEDIIDQTRILIDPSEGYQTICNRYYQWKKMFVSNAKDLLSESEIMGLIGELLFLKEYLASKIGLSSALNSWSGQELTHKDFSFGDDWYEIKTVSRGKPSVKISSLEQLESDKEGVLAVYHLERMSEAYNGIRLNNLILEITKLFISDEEKDDFLSKVFLKGWTYHNCYDSFVYEKSDFNMYSVSVGFPRLTRQNVPYQIAKVSYEILLAEIKDYNLN